jgi:hypothetical protein
VFVFCVTGTTQKANIYLIMGAARREGRSW